MKVSIDTDKSKPEKTTAPDEDKEKDPGFVWRAQAMLAQIDLQDKDAISQALDSDDVLI